MNHGGEVELKTILSKFQFGLILHNQYIIGNAVVAPEHLRRAAVTHYLYVGITGFEQSH